MLVGLHQQGVIASYVISWPCHLIKSSFFCTPAEPLAFGLRSQKMSNLILPRCHTSLSPHQHAHRVRHERLIHSSADGVTIFCLHVSQGCSHQLPPSVTPKPKLQQRCGSASGPGGRHSTPPKMLDGSRRGPKSKQWMKKSKGKFHEFFATRSEPLDLSEMTNIIPGLEEILPIKR